MLCNWPQDSCKGMNVYVPCGRCLPCRINKERVWQHRLILEKMSHLESSFQTLTYNDEHLPPGGNLKPRDLQLFLKRLRKNEGRTDIRYYAVGEYGHGGTERPHYHLALYGIGASTFRTEFQKGKEVIYSPEVRKAWTLRGKELGFTEAGDLNKDSARYMVGYITKGLVRGRSSWLAGRHKEFSRMSLDPAIGLRTVEEIARRMDSQAWCDQVGVQRSLRYGKKEWPIGRYLTCKMHEARGKDPKEDCEAEFWEWHAQLGVDSLVKGKSIYTHLREEFKSKRETLEGRARFFNRRTKL